MACLRKGDWVVDATAGNGHDSLFLAKQIGESGRLWSVDIQQQALQSTKLRLQQAGVVCDYQPVLGSHAKLAELLPAEAKGKIRAVVFNLGYLPGGDQQITTQPDSTITALQQVFDLLLPQGMLAVTLYSGHPGGAEEAAAVDNWVAKLPRKQWLAWRLQLGNASHLAPRSYLIEKIATKGS